MFFQKSCVFGVKWRLWSVSVCLLVCGRINRPRSPTKQRSRLHSQHNRHFKHRSPAGRKVAPPALAVWQEPNRLVVLRTRVWVVISALSMSFVKLKKPSTKVSVNGFITLSALVDRLPR